MPAQKVTLQLLSEMPLRFFDEDDVTMYPAGFEFATVLHDDESRDFCEKMLERGYAKIVKYEPVSIIASGKDSESLNAYLSELESGKK